MNIPKFVRHFRHAIVREADGVVIGEGESLIDAVRDARTRGHQPTTIAVECKYREYSTDTERVVLVEGHWRLVRV